MPGGGRCRWCWIAPGRDASCALAWARTTLTLLGGGHVPSTACCWRILMPLAGVDDRHQPLNLLEGDDVDALEWCA